MSDEQTQQATPDDPSGPGWRDVEPDEALQPGDMYRIGDHWQPTEGVGAQARVCGNGYRRRIEPQQTSDSEPETMEQLREQVQTLTRERDRYQSWLQEHHKTGQQSAVKKLERWLRPVIELVAEDPDDASPLAVAVLIYLPGIASRLIEE